MTEVSERPVLAIDVGGTKVAAALVADGDVRERRRIATPRTGRGKDLVDAVLGLVGELGPCDRLAVATTGVVDEGRLTALNPRTLPIEEGFPLAESLERATGVRPLVLNDAQAAAWGEYRFGAGRGTRSFAFVTVSTGIGAGVVVDGNLVVGRRGLAGHLGHVVVDPNGPPCGCGRHGCLETLASGSALARRGRDLFGPDASAPDLFAKAARGNVDASALLDDAARLLSQALGDLVATCDVERVVLGGGVGLAPSFVERVRRYVERLPEAFRRELTVAVAGADAGLVGVADLVPQAS